MGKEKKKNPYLLLSADKRIKHSLVLRSLHQICLWTWKIILGFLSEKKNTLEKYMKIVVEITNIKASHHCLGKSQLSKEINGNL